MENTEPRIVSETFPDTIEQGGKAYQRTGKVSTTMRTGEPSAE